MVKREWPDVWRDVRDAVSGVKAGGKQIMTLCRKSTNDILEVDASSIVVMSHKPLRKGVYKPRRITEEDFHYVWSKLVERGRIEGLSEIPRVRGRRAIICTILTMLPYVNGRCIKRRIILELKDP